MELQAKRIVLGVTGGIAAYKAAELVRLLGKQGADVQVAMTEGATHFVTATTFQALSGKPVFTDQWDARMPNAMAHIDLSRQADLILVAPASADFIARAAQGFADDLLATMALARDCPMLVAPAMNRQMWENPATQRNVAQLAADGVHVLGPACGEQALPLPFKRPLPFPTPSLHDLIVLITSGPLTAGTGAGSTTAPPTTASTPPITVNAYGMAWLPNSDRSVATTAVFHRGIAASAAWAAAGMHHTDCLASWTSTDDTDDSRPMPPFCLVPTTIRSTAAASAISSR